MKFLNVRLTRILGSKDLDFYGKLLNQAAIKIKNAAI